MPLTPAHYRARLQWYLDRSGWNHDDWERIVLATNLASNCVLKLIEDECGDAQDSVPILLSLLQATQALNQQLWSGVSFLLTAGLLWSSLEAHLQHNCASTTF
ncbi:hypothetical protein TNCV_2693071 [Trichonephila clavipes]|uniref:Uncharacterized protein n=1 Tax=Trichonephila clavipes TaxID=2585209 RepID=A0A8X6VZB6_TRICX|nr:hypothetical protein TNCV_2693071 [Trichonephila clavipes]